MARPSPLPPVDRLRDFSARQKRSKTYGSSSGSMPWPVSLTSILTSVSAQTALTSTLPRAAVWRTPFDTRLPIIWRMRTGSAYSFGSPSVRTVRVTPAESAAARCAVAT